MTSIPIRLVSLYTGTVWTQTCSEGGRRVDMKTGIGVVLSQAKERQRLPETTRGKREVWNGFSLTASEGTDPAGTSILDFQAPD